MLKEKKKKNEKEKNKQMIAICKNHNKDVFYVLVCDVSEGGGFECTVCLKSYVMMIQVHISGVFGYRLFF